MTMHALDDVARPEWTRERARASSMTIFGMEAPEALALTDALTAAQGRPGRGLLPSVELLVLSDKLEALGYLDTLDEEQRSLLGLASATLDVERDSLYISRLVEALLGRAWMLGTRLDKPEFAERGRTVRFCGTLEWKLIHEREPGEVWMAAAVQATDVQEIVIPRPLRISAWSRAEVLAEIGALYLTPPPWGERADVHALATRCEADRGAFTKAVKKIARENLDKTSRFTDWSRRPLSEAQKARVRSWFAPAAPTVTYASLADRLHKCDDADTAALIVDEARALPQDQQDELAAIYTSKFQPQG